MKIVNFFKDIILGKNKKTSMETLIIFIIIGVIVLIAGSTLFKPTSANTQKTTEPKSQPAGITGQSGTSALEARLRSILSQIEDAGRVDIMITYAGSKEYIPAFDSKNSGSSTEETDSSGGTRKIIQSSTDNSIVYDTSQSGEKKPFILKETEAPVKGVLVVADGASRPQVREKLVRAVQVLMDVPVHKIAVIEKKK